MDRYYWIGQACTGRRWLPVLARLRAFAFLLLAGGNVGPYGQYGSQHGAMRSCRLAQAVCAQTERRRYPSLQQLLRPHSQTRRRLVGYIMRCQHNIYQHRQLAPSGIKNTHLYVHLPYQCSFEKYWKFKTLILGPLAILESLQTLPRKLH